MDKITEVTRRDILDAIRDGFEVLYDEPLYNGFNGEYETGYEVKMPFYGRLDEISFFSRIYDLKNLPSHDHRYNNALEDIKCHLYWGDYPDDCWFFDDQRFKLRHGDGDTTLLKFICEMLHPTVRDENSQWKDYLEKFNSLLRVDGYELYPAQCISGREVYKARSYIQPIIPTLPAMLFSERYKELLKYGSGEPVDKVSNKVSDRAKKHLVQVMVEFREPIQYRPSRYDNWVENTDALKEAVRRLNCFLDIDAVSFHDTSLTEEQILAGIFTPFLFDLIELQYDELSANEKSLFKKKVNQLLQEDNLPFELSDSGLIGLVAEYEPLASEIIEKIQSIHEDGLKELLNLALEKHLQPDTQAHKDAVEKIWAALERLKTYYSSMDKKSSVEKIVNDMAGGQAAYISLFDEEFRALTRLGNDFRIRHHETNKIDITDIHHYDYFFNRCLSLISLAIQYLE